MSIAKDPHAGQPVLAAGPAPRNARLALILVHGRGASAEDILGLAAELQLSDVACLAPQAAGHTWYPYSFLSPIEQNEPGISSGLGVIGRVIDDLGGEGLPPGRIGLLGFSQGACLSLEFAARNARRYAGVFALSGGLIGPPGTPRTYDGAFDGTPVFLGCSDVDPHIPAERVRESEAVFRRLGAAVTRKLYPGMGHIVSGDEIENVQRVMDEVLA